MEDYQITIESRFKESGHDEAWRDEVGKELNRILVHTQGSTDALFVKAALSIAARVSEFEEIEPAP